MASPPSSHLELALMTCAAGKPCLVEKPLARTLQESRQIVDAFEAAGVPLFVSCVAADRSLSPGPACLQAAGEELLSWRGVT